MARIYLVRHGQASFGQANYDQLSALGWRQARLLGTHWRQGQPQRQAGRRPDFAAVYTGTLQRQLQTWQGIAEGAGLDPRLAVQRKALNEYNVPAIIAAAHPGPLEKSREPAAYRRRLQALRHGLLGWMQGHLQPQGLPPYAQFRASVMAVLDEIRSRHRGDVLVVSSAGPIAAVLSHLLAARPATVVELNLAYRNSAVTELLTFEARLRLMAFNALPHLQGQAQQELISWI